jgi:hypothetical protein
VQPPPGIRALATCLIATLLCSCVGTSLKQTWKSSDYHGAIGKVAAVAIEDRGDVRQAFENRFVSELQKHGTSAFATGDILSQAEIKADRTAAAARLRAAGADTVLVVRMVDSSSSYGAAWLKAGGPGPAGSDDWSDYYHADMGSSYGSLKQTTAIETSLFDLKTGKRLWSGLTETVTGERTDRVAEADKVVAKVVGAMRKDGMIR